MKQGNGQVPSGGVTKSQCQEKKIGQTKKDESLGDGWKRGEGLKGN